MTPSNPSNPSTHPTHPTHHPHHPRQSNQSDSRPISRSGSLDPCHHHHHPPPLATTTLSSNIISNTTQNHSITNLFDPLPTLTCHLRRAALKLVPPPNFGFVEGSLFRSGEPAELSFDFLKRLNLKTLIWLAPKPPAIRFQQFLNQNHLQFHDLGIQHAASLDALTEESVTLALQLILNPNIYPLMIMCGGGSHRTGTVIGCFRKLQGWNLASIFEEYRRYAGAQHHIMNEQFIEFYDTNRLISSLLTQHEHPSSSHHLNKQSIDHQSLNEPQKEFKSDNSNPEQIYKRVTPSEFVNHQN
ncbi:hypothetical protein O181_070674 [Austropuccinia psidii MF-1]|uniref:Putative tyrosine-protein phosphatase OCA1 n=1 Tax=Austropuccinia psidii MF-1 TaxID=1389203 RepID=A0A9Q3F1Q7_9BASI|nr:hypothetical protein [Austropuccinia psidii MF-1]